MKDGALYEALLEPHAVLLESSRSEGTGGRSVLFRAPLKILALDAGDDTAAFFSEVDAALAAGHFVAGHLNYELAAAFERGAMPVRGGRPLARLGVYHEPDAVPPEALQSLLKSAGPGGVGEARFSYTRDAYLHCIEAIRDHIREGDVYQINFTGKMRFAFEGDPVAFYATLRFNQPVSYGAFLNLGDRQILSLSPELFFRIDGERITARPMKGTAPRGRFAEEDAAIAPWLRNDPKSRAENLMIVDLLRNDLSRVCREGSVTVPHLFQVERYPTVFQMTSTVEGRLRGGMTPHMLLSALFPCGSVTGAPKIRAMQVISNIEKEPRGLYTGAIGFFAPNGDAAFNVAIRTVEIGGGHGEMGVGSGIVWDSDANAEYDECLLKAAFLKKPAVEFQLIETMRWEGGVALLDAHVQRLKSSAEYFDFRFDAPAVRAAIEATGAELSSGRPFKMRLLLFRDGRTTISASALEVDGRAWRLGFSEERIDSRDPLYFHKTTRRSVHEAAYERASAAGLDEAILRNERGEVTEGSRTNIFVRKGRSWKTPPVDSGLLRGVYRSYLLQTLPGVTEAVLYPEDVLTADEVIVCNAVRGVIPASVG